MYGHAVALVCILFLSTSALVTRSPLPSPRARVCILRCVRVHVALNIPDRVCFVLFILAMVASFSIPACLLVFPSSSFPLFLPPSYFLYCPRPSLSHFRQLWVFFYFFPFGTAVTPCLSFPSPNLVSTLDLCTHEPSLRGASCMPEALFWFALPEVWLLVFFQKQLTQHHGKNPQERTRSQNE